MTLWQEMLNLGLQPERTTFDHVISIASYVTDGSEQQWEHVEGALRQMAAQGVRPGPSTLTATLQAIPAAWRSARDTALAAWREFRQLGVQPSLAGYYSLLSLFYRDRSNFNLLEEILNEIEGREFTVQHIMDTFFFVTAMEVARHKHMDRDLGLRVDRLLHTGNNWRLMGDSYKERVYYRHYMSLMSLTEPVEEFMADTYRRLVPNVYTPEPGIMEGLVKEVNMAGAVQLLPRLWTDMVTFQHLKRKSLMEAVLTTLALNPGADAAARRQLGDLAWDLFQRVEAVLAEGNNQNRIDWTGPMLGDLLVALARAGMVARAARVLRKLEREQTAIVGVPQPAAVQALLEAALQEQQAAVGTLCVRYASEMGFAEAQAWCDTLLSTLTVGEAARLQLAAAGLSGTSSDS